jgi:hypothetical protein
MRMSSLHATCGYRAIRKRARHGGCMERPVQLAGDVHATPAQAMSAGFWGERCVRYTLTAVTGVKIIDGAGYRSASRET